MQNKRDIPTDLQEEPDIMKIAKGMNIGILVGDVLLRQSMSRNGYLMLFDEFIETGFGQS